MDISPRSVPKRASEPIDEWLKTEGYFRKNAPHDATCLFRAVSEQVYLTQFYHLKVRQECVDFMRKNKQQFQESVKVPIDHYLDQLACVTEWGGSVEVQAMALLYKCDFVIFNAPKLDRRVATNNGYKKFIYLCQITSRIYESVYEREIIAPAAYCQSLVYQTLYKDVFKMSEIDDVVQKMLHQRNLNMRHDKFYTKNNMEHRDPPTAEQFNKIETNDCTDTMKFRNERAPFPYRIAKALDPNIYRNIDFDIWHEIRKEVRSAGWTRWNDSELQIGAKCLVQLNTDKENIDETNNNSQSSPESKKSKKVPALLFGHIQEMSGDEGPVVVFIEELGEKRTVPYKALKPLLATRKPQLPLGVISPRKHSFDQPPKWKNKWNQSGRKFKDSGVIFSGLDSMNNNDYSCEKSKKCHGTDWTDDNFNNPTMILKNFTGVENYSSAGNFVNSIEVRPVSIVLDNPQPLLTTASDQKEEQMKASPVPNNNSVMVNNNNINPTDAFEKSHNGASMNERNVPTPPGILQPTNQPSPVQPHQEPYYAQTVAPMYAANANLMCVSSETAMYPIQYYQGNQSENPTPGIGAQDRGLRPINISAPISTDINGGDLPYNDPATLRFFYNLGVETFRFGQMWPPTGPVAYGSGYVPQANVMPIMSPVMTADAPQGMQSSPRNEETLGQNAGPRQGYQQGRRRSDQGNSGRNSGMSGDSRGNRTTYPRKGDNYDGNYQRNDGSNPQEYQKPKTGYGNNDEKEGGNREQRKNSGGRYKKNNDGRNRSFDRNSQFQHDYQHKSRENIQGGNFRGKEGHSFQRMKNEPIHQVHQSPQASPGTGGAGGQFHQPYGQPPAYNSVQYYPNESENYYSSNPNFYPVPFLPAPTEVPEGGNVGSYVCSAHENYPPPMSPMYPAYVLPPAAIYPSVTPPNAQENWYSVPANQSYVPYAQVPVTQPPPTISSRPPTTS